MDLLKYDLGIDYSEESAKGTRSDARRVFISWLNATDFKPFKHARLYAKVHIIFIKHILGFYYITILILIAIL